MVWILAISAATTSRAALKSSSGVTSWLRITCEGSEGLRRPLSASDFAPPVGEIRRRRSCARAQTGCDRSSVRSTSYREMPPTPVLSTAAARDRRAARRAGSHPRIRGTDSSSIFAESCGSRFTRFTEVSSIAVKLGGVPPGGIVVCVSLGRAGEISMPAHGELLWGRIVQHIRLVDGVVRAAA